MGGRGAWLQHQLAGGYTPTEQQYEAQGMVSPQQRQQMAEMQMRTEVEKARAQAAMLGLMHGGQMPAGGLQPAQPFNPGGGIQQPDYTGHLAGIDARLAMKGAKARTPEAFIAEATAAGVPWEHIQNYGMRVFGNTWPQR